MGLKRRIFCLACALFSFSNSLMPEFTVDQALDRFRSLCISFKDFCSKHGKITEADTRANIIDKIICEVLVWPEDAIRREVHVERGYIDYHLSINGKEFIVIEAKKEGTCFDFPTGNNQRSYKLSGALMTSGEIKKAILQARGYCDDAGIRYAVATNGYAWITFRAIREDKPWKEGHAVVFDSWEAVTENFTSFWNLLSYYAVSNGALDEAFGSKLKVDKQYNRVLGMLYNADLPLQRNRLHNELHPIIKTIFEDIADQDHLEILKSCYVHTESLKIVAHDLDLAITDEVPAFLKKEGIRTIQQSDAHAGHFGDSIEASIESDRGQLYLILGGIGSGKTTFLRRYQRTVGATLLNEKSLWFSVNFLGAPLDANQMEDYVWSTILEQLRSRYQSPHLETRKNLKRAFKLEIEALDQTLLRYAKPSSEEYEKLLSPYLAKWQADVSIYVPKLLALCKPKKNIKVVLFIDNVDQLSSSYQALIFLLAQRVTRSIGSITIVAMREESYYTASIQNTFTAFTNKKFHIASPKFLVLVRNRISYSLQLLREPNLLAESESFGSLRDDIVDFFKIADSCINGGNSKAIVNFIESLCFGNMRLALQMFTTFLASGATDVDKMLHIYRRDGYYAIAFHEFVKSIMLGDRKYYKEDTCPIINVFEIAPSENNSSHFTALRILDLFLRMRGEANNEGRGYYEIGKAAAYFDNLFDNRADFIRNMNKLVRGRLIEVNTRSQDTILGASHARVTSAGWYYRRRLIGNFTYLDLVLQDTPICDYGLVKTLRNSIVDVDNLPDPEQFKLPRLKVRLDRVEKFLNYLDAEEKAEACKFNLGPGSSLISLNIIPRLMDAFRNQSEWILNRVKENRERYGDETLFELGPEDQEVLSNIFDEGSK
jgi:hypothetical protein